MANETLTSDHCYYNENDPKAAAWLRELIKVGAIAPGEVDDRSILDVAPADLRGFRQCHFFAGIGVWSYALRLAGWPDSRAVWTGSCPCQPFSTVGKGGGFADERHLWPAWFHLIEQCRPPSIFGEQVANKDGLAWLDLVLADLGGASYTATAIDLCAAGFGAPHIRQRLWIVGDARGERAWRDAGAVPATQAQCDRQGSLDGAGDLGAVSAGAVGGHWRGAEWIACSDGRYRPVEPGTFPLAHGAPARVGRLRGYGNAIVAQVAAEVIAAYLEAA